MTNRAIHKLFDTAPIGRCPCCGTPTYDMAALNVRCEECGDGVVASVAMRDWRRCPACQRTGKSLIAAATEDGSCPVCAGTGWITLAEYPAAESELAVAQSAIDNALDAATPQHVDPSRYSCRSRLGSVPHPTIPKRLTKTALRRLQNLLLAYQTALDNRIATPVAKRPSRLRFLSGDALTKLAPKSADR